MEICDAYDRDGRPTGLRFARGEAVPPGCFLLAVNLWIVGDGPKLLIQKRSARKAWLPGAWATHGGVVGAGETSLSAVLREVREEIGFVVPPGELTRLYRSVGGQLMVDNYVTRFPFDRSKAVLQREEVDDLRWATLPELDALRAAGEFFDYPNFDRLVRYIRETSEKSGGPRS